jgi:hypothetical protein
MHRAKYETSAARENQQAMMMASIVQANGSCDGEFINVRDWTRLKA